MQTSVSDPRLANLVFVGSLADSSSASKPRPPEPSPTPLSALLQCPSCHATIASLRQPRTRVFVDFGPRDYTQTVVRDFVIGCVVTLEPGFVNAKTRHPSGPSWYRQPTGRTGSESRRVRLPAVATCGCGADVLLSSVLDGEARFFASSGLCDRREKMNDILADEGLDRAVDAEIDRRRELRSGAKEAD